METKQITKFMIDDHKYLDKLWSNFMLEIDNTQKAEGLFLKFYEHINMHMELEDTILFPLFDSYVGLENGVGPSVLMQRDHSTISKLLNEVKDNFSNNDFSKAKLNGMHLHRALEKHRERESKMQYPLFDRFISTEEWKEVIKEIYKI